MLPTDSRLGKQRVTVADMIEDRIFEDYMAYSCLDFVKTNYEATWEEACQKVYVQCECKADVATISDPIPYPPEIVVRIQDPSVSRVFMGALPRFELFYCIIDETITFWRCHDAGIQTVSEGVGGCIATVECGDRNREVFRKSVEGIVCYTTFDYLKIVPVVSGKLQLDSVISVSCRGNNVDLITITEDGEIYVASYMSVYRVVLARKETAIEGKVVRLPEPWFYFSVLKWMNWFIPCIVQIACLEHRKLVAVLRTDSSILFYDVTEKDAPAIWTVFRPVNTIIKRICPVYYNSRIFLIAFAENGQRLLFTEFSLGFGQAQQIRLTPPYLENQAVILPDETLSGSISVYERGVVVTQASAAHECEMNLVESFAKFDFGDEELLHYFRAPQRKFRNLPLFNSDLMWQHVMSVNPGYLMSAKGVRIINFGVPFERLERYMKSHGMHSKEFQSWKIAIGFDELVATALVLVAKKPNTKSLVMNLLYEVAPKQDLKTQKHCLISGFLIRISRLLLPVWHEYIVKEERGRSVIGVIENMPKTIHDDLESVRVVGTELVQNMKEEETNKVQSRLREIILFVEEFLERITFFRLFENMSKRTINNMISGMDSALLATLRVRLFGTLELSALRQFVGYSYRYFDKRGQVTIQTKCTNIFSYNDVLLAHACNALKTEVHEGSLAGIVQQICSTMSETSNLAPLCNELAKKKYWKGLVDVCIRKATLIDTTYMSLRWYKTRDPDDELGEQSFNDVYFCYLPVLRHVYDCMDHVLATNVELLHILCFHRIHKVLEDVDFLVSLKSPYVEAYIKAECPLHLWDFYKRSSDYYSAAVSLMKYLDATPELLIQDRITLLAQVAALSVGSSSLKQTAQIKLSIAEIQLLMKTRMSLFSDSDELDTYILDANDLFARCAACGYWDLAIELATICSLPENNRPYLMSILWANMFAEQLRRFDLLFVHTFLTDLITKVGHLSINLYELVLLMENYRLSKGGNPQWTFDTLRNAGFSASSLIETYTRILANPDVTGAWRNDLRSVIHRT